MPGRLEIDRGRSIREQAGKGHNRWHPDIPPVASVAPGGDPLRMGYRRGALHLHARHFRDLYRGTVVVEGVWPSGDFEEGIGIKLLVGADPVPPAGGVASHDTAVWVRPA